MIVVPGVWPEWSSGVLLTDLASADTLRDDNGRGTAADSDGVAAGGGGGAAASAMIPTRHRTSLGDNEFETNCRLLYRRWCRRRVTGD